MRLGSSWVFICYRTFTGLLYILVEDTSWYRGTVHIPARSFAHHRVSVFKCGFGAATLLRLLASANLVSRVAMHSNSSWWITQIGNALGALKMFIFIWLHNNAVAFVQDRTFLRTRYLLVNWLHMRIYMPYSVVTKWHGQLIRDFEAIFSIPESLWLESRAPLLGR